MRFSYVDLQAAVITNNVTRLQEILRDRDPATGRPYLDINNMPGVNLQDRNLLLFIFDRANPSRPDQKIDLTADSTREMVLSILAVRDNDANPVINLNATTFGKATTLEMLFSTYRFLSQSNGRYGYHANRRNFLIMVDALINARNAAGDRILDLDVVGYESPLLSAIILGDADLVSMLLDLRNADGSFAIDVNIPYFINDPHPRTPLDAAHVGHISREHSDRDDFQPNPRILQMLQDRGALRYAQLNTEQRVNYQTKHQRMEDDLWRRAGLEPIVRVAPPVRAAAPVVRDPIPRVGIGRPPAVPAPTHVSASVAAFDRNSQNTHNPEVERTVSLSILQLKKTYESAIKPSFADIRRDIEALINTQVGGRLYTAEQIHHIRRGFSYVCNNPESLHAESSLRMPDIMALVWLGIHDKSKMPEDFPASGDKDLFVKTRKTALLDKFLAIATTYPGGGTSCLGGTRNLIVQTLDKAHPDVSIAPTSEAVAELGLGQAKRFMLDKLNELPIREQRAILRTWNEPDGDGIDGKTPATKFKERVKPLLDTELNQKLGTILPADFFTTLNAQYEYFPEPVVHSDLADLCKKIRELPDDLSDGIAMLKSSITNASIFGDTDKSFDDEYRKLKLKNDILLSPRDNKTELGKLVEDIEKYNKDKTESRFSKNAVKSAGAVALLGFLETLKNLDPVNVSRALDSIEKTLATDENKYFGLKFDTWFFAKERQSELKGYFERAKTIISDVLGDQRVGSVSPRPQ